MRKDLPAAVLESLTTTIESINQRLAGAGKGSGVDESSAKQLQQTMSWL